MGTGYNRNVSQWSKGEYYNANNTQDDLAVIAGKLAYRPDDHGNTPGTATALVITDGNQIVSTNFENDPDNTNGSPRVATYSLPPPGGSEWTAVHNGTYSVAMEVDEVADTQGAFVAAGTLGEFQVALPVPIYSANMAANPGWTLQSGSGQDPGWQYGAPNYAGNANAPAAGFTGSNVIAYNLSGDYPARLGTPRYATTPPIDVSSASNLTLQFRRWLRLTNQGNGTIEVSTNGTSWTPIWSGSGVTDSSWQLMQYALPSSVEGSSSLRIRWGLSSGNRPQTDIGWNIDDVLILGDGALDTDPPVATLNVGDVTLSGSPSHSCGVTYTDATAVRLASLDEFNLVVEGPNGFTTFSVDGDGIDATTLGFNGADSAVDASPLTASYDIPAPDGSAWTAADNGTYTDLISFINTTSGIGNTSREISLTVSTAAQPARFSSYAFRADGVFEFVISGRPGDLLRVDWSENLIDWNVLINGEIGPEGTLTLDDPDSSQRTRRFYRLVSP